MPHPLVLGAEPKVMELDGVDGLHVLHLCAVQGGVEDVHLAVRCPHQEVLLETGVAVGPARMARCLGDHAGVGCMLARRGTRQGAHRGEPCKGWHANKSDLHS